MNPEKELASGQEPGGVCDDVAAAKILHTHTQSAAANRDNSDNVTFVKASIGIRSEY